MQCFHEYIVGEHLAFAMHLCHPFVEQIRYVETNPLTEILRYFTHIVAVRFDFRYIMRRFIIFDAVDGYRNVFVHRTLCGRIIISVHLPYSIRFIDIFVQLILSIDKHIECGRIYVEITFAQTELKNVALWMRLQVCK